MMYTTCIIPEQKHVGLKNVYFEGYLPMVPGIFNCKRMLKQRGKQEKTCGAAIYIFIVKSF